MKRVVVKVLAAMGLVPARRYDEMSRRLRDLTRERDDWMKRTTKAVRRERTLQQHTRDLERQLQKEVRRRNRQVADTHRVAEDQTGAPAAVRARLADAETIEARLAESERALAVAREHLNAIEVKLEILEGAANVLDVRTRVALQHQPDKTGAAVP